MSVADLPSIAEELALMRGADKSVKLKRTYSGSKAKVGGSDIVWGYLIGSLWVTGQFRAL